MNKADNRKIYFALGGTLTALIFFNYFGWLGPVKNLFNELFLGSFKNINSTGQNVNRDFGYFLDKQSFFTAYEKCTKDVEQLKILTASNRLLEEENSELKKLIGFKERTKIQIVAARVVGRSPDGVEKSIIIDQGGEAGIRQDQPVVVGDGILIGKISKVEDRISFVRLISDNQNKVAATILNKDKSLGVVEGGYGISVRMNFIPRNEIILIGDEVVSSGLETNVPRGLVIGTVAAIENEAYQPFQQAVLTPATDLSKISQVAVLISK